MGLSQEGCAEQRKELCVPPLLMMTPFVGGERFFFRNNVQREPVFCRKAPLAFLSPQV